MYAASPFISCCYIVVLSHAPQMYTFFIMKAIYLCRFHGPLVTTIETFDVDRKLEQNAMGNKFLSTCYATNLGWRDELGSITAVELVYYDLCQGFCNVGEFVDEIFHPDL